MTDVVKGQDSGPTPAERTGGPPSGVGGPHDGSGEAESNARNEGGVQ